MCNNESHLLKDKGKKIKKLLKKLLKQIAKQIRIHIKMILLIVGLFVACSGKDENWEIFLEPDSKPVDKKFTGTVNGSNHLFERNDNDHEFKGAPP